MFGWFKKKTKAPRYTQDDLAAEVMAESQKRFPKEKFIYDKKMNVVRPVSGDAAQTFLGNIFNVVKDMSAQDRQAYIEDFFNTVTQTSGELTLDVLNAYLMTRVRTSAEVGLRNLTLGARGSDIDFFTVEVGDLLFDLTVDYGNTISTPPKDTLSEVAGGDQNVLDLALQNLKKISDETPWEKTAPHVWASKYQDDYDAARLICLYPEFELPDGVESPIVYMPSHNVCLIAERDDLETLKTLVETGDELAADARRLSTALWHNTGSGWEIFTLDKTHPSYGFVNPRTSSSRVFYYIRTKRMGPFSLVRSCLSGWIRFCQKRKGSLLLILTARKKSNF
jgi:hypothetical protein